MTPAILVVTGASGSGKTTDALAVHIENVRAERQAQAEQANPANGAERRR